MIPFKFVKTAGIAAAFGPETGPPVDVRKTSDIPHCKVCGKKMPKGSEQCKYCGNPGTTGRENSEQDNGPDPGAGAAVAESTSDLSKYSNFGVELGKNILGGGVLVGSGYGAATLIGPSRQMALEERKRKAQELVMAGKLPESELLKYQHVEKRASRKGGNPIINLRRALEKMRNSTGKYRASMVYNKK